MNRLTALVAGLTKPSAILVAAVALAACGQGTPATPPSPTVRTVTRTVTVTPAPTTAPTVAPRAAPTVAPVTVQDARTGDTTDLGEWDGPEPTTDLGDYAHIPRATLATLPRITP